MTLAEAPLPSTWSGAAVDDVPGTLRVLSYNVRSLRDDPAAVASVIRAARPDVVCVQEAPRFLRWRSKCAALARESGLVVVTGGRPAGAMLLLAALRVRIRATKDVKLRKHFRLHQRGLAIAEIEVGGIAYAVASMHLSLDDTERLAQADEVFAKLADQTAPLILAGDVNETPAGPAWARLGDRLTDGGGGHTYSAKRPHKRIDAVFADPRLEFLSCDVPEAPGIEVASDHRPLLAVVRPR
ncbi:MAG: endonuclease/exonuclease/phosphatase family protein [Frankiaceae bacterium]